ncbi:MAG: cation:proton antiporter [Planctomycetota bacterium]
MNDVERITTLLASVFALGIGAQCIAWRARVPAILLLILAGLAAGPITGYLDPDKLLGPLLSPIVSLSVAIILFEGGLNLRLRELAGTGTALIGLLTVGVAITAASSAALAYWILDMPLSVAILLGSILVVTGPTVLGPLLRQIRPSGKVGSVARWEGVVIDPIGATLAVLVFEVETVIGTTNYESVFAATAMGLASTTFVGVSIGLVMAAMMLLLLRFFLVSDHLQGGVALACVLAAFAVAELFKNEAGLLAVTVMGLVLANQKKVRIDTIAEFKENLSVILISCLFILLAARVRMDHLLDVGRKGLLFVAAMIVVVRPLSVFASTMGSGLNIRERLFLAWLAPRGIVAAAVSSVFAIELGEKAGSMASVAFLVILGTVAVYGMTSGLVARALGLATKDAQGFLIAGQSPCLRNRP